MVEEDFVSAGETHKSSNSGGGGPPKRRRSPLGFGKRKSVAVRFHSDVMESGLLPRSAQPGPIMSLEEQQVEEPQLDSSVSSATACRTPCWDFSSSLQFASHFLSTHTPFFYLAVFPPPVIPACIPRSSLYIFVIYNSFLSAFQPKDKSKYQRVGLVPHGARSAPYYTLSWAHRYMERTFMHYTSSPILTQSQFLRRPQIQSNRSLESPPVGLQRQNLRRTSQVDQQ